MDANEPKPSKQAKSTHAAMRHTKYLVLNK
jgi:hypothetical protein